MAVNYRTALKNARLQAVIDDVGSAGLLKIGTAGMAATLATITLASPAFGAPAAGQMALAGTPRTDASADATGGGVAATICKSDGTVVVDGLTVGAVGSGANIELNSTAIQINTEVRVDSGTFVHA